MATENEENGPIIRAKTSLKLSRGLRNPITNPVQKSDNLPLKTNEADCTHEFIGKAILLSHLL